MAHLFGCQMLLGAMLLVFDLPEHTLPETAWGLKPFRVTYLASAFLTYHRIRQGRAVVEPELIVNTLAAAFRQVSVRARAR